MNIDKEIEETKERMKQGLRLVSIDSHLKALKIIKKLKGKK